MATTAVDLVFIDTNILVYAAVPTAPLHSASLAELAALQSAPAELWISRQVIREFLAVLSRPQSFATATPMNQLLAVTAVFERDFALAEDGPAVGGELRNLLASFPCAGKQVHDANIAATMLAHGIGKLLTNNVADFNRFASVISIIPLVP